MRISECGQIIVACGWFDNRKNSDEAMTAWSKAINERITVTEAIDAVAVHYSTTSDWCTPAHINAIVRTLHLQRLTDAGTPPIPEILGDARDAEMKWVGSWQNHIRHGADPDAAAAAADTEHGITQQAIAGSETRVRAIEALAVNMTNVNRQRNAPLPEDYSVIGPCEKGEAVTRARGAARKQPSQDNPETPRLMVHSIGRRHMNWELEHLVAAIEQAETVEWCRGRGHDLAVVVDGRRTWFRVGRPADLRVSA